ncbi:MAG: hypothetical protein R3C20_00030 [Planctomycetaceae bacterium]
MKPLSQRIHSFLSALFIAGLLICTTDSVVAQTSTPFRESSLSLIPADAAFFSSSLRMKEQLDIFLNSNAFQKIQSQPLVMMGMAQAQAMWQGDDDFQEFREIVEQPENQELIALLADAFSNDIFVYGDANVTSTISEVSDFYGFVYSVAFKDGAMNRRRGPASMDEETQLLLIREGKERLKRLKFPGIAMGARVSDADRVNRQIQRLEVLLRQLAARISAEEDLPFDPASLISRRNINGESHLTISFHGNLIPWDEIQREMNDIPAAAVADVEEILGNLKERSIQVTLGVRKDYLLLTISADDSLLNSLGEGSLLMDTDVFAPVNQHAEERIVSVQYVSEELASIFGDSGKSIEQMFDNFAQMLPALEIPEKYTQLLSRDLPELGDDLAELLPVFGRQLGCSWLTERGYEGYFYQRVDRSGLDSSAPLELMHHIGNAPLFAYVTRAVTPANSSELMDKWCSRTNEYIELGVADLEEEEGPQVRKLWNQIQPLFPRLGDAIRNDLTPAFKESQSALVLDGTFQRKQFHPMMPPSSELLTLPTPVVIQSVTSRSHVESGMSKVMSVLDDLLTIIRDSSPNAARDIPFETIPRPVQVEVDGGTLYKYELPPQLEVDSGIAPNAGLNDQVLVMSLLPEVTERMFAESAPKIPGPAGDLSQPLGSALWLDFEGCVDASLPWIRYGFSVAKTNYRDNMMVIVMAEQQTLSIVDLLKCFRGYSSASWIQEGDVVTHFELLMQDSR